MEVTHYMSKLSQKIHPTMCALKAESFYIVFGSMVLVVVVIMNLSDYKVTLTPIFFPGKQINQTRNIRSNKSMVETKFHTHYSFNVSRSKLINVQFLKYKTKAANYRKTISIMFMNKPGWIDLNPFNQFLKNECPYSNCVAENGADNISKWDAVVFDGSGGFNGNLKTLLRQRTKDQVWIFIRMEPPENGGQSWYKDPILRNTMNWSWGYRTDSDIFRPIQILQTRSDLQPRNYENIYRGKTKMAAWVVSNCKTKSLRDVYVSKLVTAGVQVDIYGSCSKTKRRIPMEAISEMINKDYLFYLSFENNFCKDYVTEKFYGYFNLDVVLVVRGGLNYSENFDKSTFIDASDYQKAEDLASYLKTLSKNESEYVTYLQNKDRYVTIGSPTDSLHQSGCSLCEKLNRKDRHKRVYENIWNYIHKGTCFNPKLVN